MTCAFLYVTDKRGFELTIHSAMSVSLSQAVPRDIHVFCYEFMPEQASELRAAMADAGSNLTFHSISDRVFEQHRTPGRATKPALLKLSAVAKLTMHYDLLAYLDHDILVFKPLNIEMIDFELKPLAAVLDMDLSRQGTLRMSTWLIGNGGTTSLGHYFNSGFMVFHSANLNRADYLSVYADALKRHERQCSFKIDCTCADQCALNMTFDKNWVSLPPGFNIQAGAKFTKHWKTAPVRHFCGARKFLPMALFRNDSRDIRYLNRIRDKLDLPRMHFPMLYEALFRLNVVRQYRTARSIRRYIDAVQAVSSLAPSP